MSWVKLDDGFPEHPKIERAGGDAAWLYVCAVAYASRNETDGYVPIGRVGRLTDRKAPEKLADKLTECLLWHGPGETCDSDVCPAHYRPVPADGYVIHDYWGYQPTKAETSARREDIKAKRSEAGQRGAHNRWHLDNPHPDCPLCDPMANDMANDMAKRSQRNDPDPTRPDPTRRDQSPIATTDDDRHVAALSSSSDIDLIINVLARVAYARAKSKNAVKGSESAFLNGTRKNIAKEQGEAICELLDDGMTVLDVLYRYVGDTTTIRWAMKQEGLGGAA